jgi:hypothetical protein
MRKFSRMTEVGEDKRAFSSSRKIFLDQLVNFEKFIRDLKVLKFSNQ